MGWIRHILTLVVAVVVIEINARVVFPGGTSEMRPSSKGVMCDAKKCPWKLWSHYIEMGCVPIKEKGTCCPSRFKCPPQSSEDLRGCRFRGRTFESGSSINQTNPCQKCMCREGYGDRPNIECMSIECPEHFSPPEPGCTMLYKEKECCSVSTQCISNDDFSAKKPEVTCKWGNRTYIEGENIYPDEDQCVVCVCRSDFNGIRGPGCREVNNCFLENGRQLETGCIPVYHVDTCCPIDWKCPKFDIDDPSLFPDGMCSFDGRRYPVGSKLHTGDRCTNCTCLTPPVFTCIQRHC